MSDYQFENTYVELEQYLRRITNIPEWAGVIAMYQKILPPCRADDLDMLRKYRNAVVAHGRKVGGATPFVPQPWIDCLKSEIDYIKENEKEVSEAVLEIFKKQNSLSFPSALERIFNSRKTDEEVMDSFWVFSKLMDIAGTGLKAKRTILSYYEIDRKLHLFQSIMQDNKDMYSCYADVADVVGKQEFFNIVEIVENLVKREREEDDYDSIKMEEESSKSKAASDFIRDPTYWECLRLAVGAKTISSSFFQRKLCIGYVRACTIIGQMEKDGFIKKKSIDSHSWNVLLTETMYKKQFGLPRLASTSKADNKIEDVLYKEAVKLIVIENAVSISFLQRKFSMAYNKAGAIIEQMEKDGIISEFSEKEARKVLLTKKEYEKKFGKLD